jgi:hypothetical protein
MDGFVYDVSRRDLAAIIDAMPFDTCRRLYSAARTGDTATAQHLLREAAASFFASTPAAPALALEAPSRRTRRQRCTPTRSRC